MKRKLIAKRVSALALATVMATAPVSAMASDLTDHWAEGVMTSWQKQGLISGFSDGTMRPNATVTRAQFVSMVNAALGFTTQSNVGFSDVGINDWFYSAVNIAATAGYASGANGAFSPNSNVTREQAAQFVFAALGVPAGTVTTFTDAGSISSWAQGAVGAMSSAGYLSGRTNGAFDPKASMTRAEAVSFLDRVMNGGVSTTTPTTPETTKESVTIANSGDVLQNEVINGDLTIATTVGDGEVYLDNVTVNGDVYIKGGGDDSIYAKNLKVTGTVYIEKDGVRLEVSKDTYLPRVSMGTYATIEGTNDFTGTIGTVSFNSAISKSYKTTLDVDVTNVIINASVSVLLEGAVSTVAVGEAAGGAVVSLGSAASVDDMSVEAGVTITGTGTIEELSVTANGVSIGSNVKVENETTADGVTTETDTDTSTGGSGGGSSSNAGTGNAGSSNAGSGDETPGAVTSFTLTVTGNASASASDLEFETVADAIAAIGSDNAFAFDGTDYTFLDSHTYTIVVDIPADPNRASVINGDTPVLTTYAGTNNLTIELKTNLAEALNLSVLNGVVVTFSGNAEIAEALTFTGAGATLAVTVAAAAIEVADAAIVAVKDATSVQVTGDVATVTVSGTVPTVTAKGGDVVVAAGADVTTVAGTAGTITTSEAVEIAANATVVDVKTDVAVELTGANVGTVTVAVADATISGTAIVGVVEANAALTIDVTVGEVVVTADVTVTLESTAVVDTVSVSEALTAVEIAAVSGATLETIKVTTAASGETATGTEIKVTGTIENATGNDVVVEQEATVTTSPTITDSTGSVDTTVVVVLADSMFTVGGAAVTNGEITITGEAGAYPLVQTLVNSGAATYKYQLNGTAPTADALATSGETTVPTLRTPADEATEDVVYIVSVDGTTATSKLYTLTITYVKGAVTATLAGSDITGTADEAMTAQDLTITLVGDTFNAMEADEDVTAWFNAPTGIEFEVKEAVSASDATATITVSGTPTAVSTDDVTLTVPTSALEVGDEAVIATSTLKYAIAAATVTPPETTTVDKTALTGAITTAEAAATAITVDKVAENVFVDTKWILQADLDTYKTAIAAAKIVADDAAATAEEVATAVSTLATATTAFESAQENGTKPVYTHTVGVTADNISNSGADATFTAADGSANAKVEFIADGGSVELTAVLSEIKTVSVDTTTWTLKSATGLSLDKTTGETVTLTSTANTAVDVIETTLTVANAAGESIVVDIVVAGVEATNEIDSVTFGTQDPVLSFDIDDSAKTIDVVATGGTVDMTAVVNVISTSTEIAAYTDLVYAVTGRGITLDDNSKTEVTGRATADLIVAENTDSEAVTGTLTVSHDGAASVEYAITVAAAPAAVPTAPSATGGEGTITITADASAAWAAAKYEYTAESDFTDSTKVSTTSFDVATGGTITGLAADDYIVRVAADTATPQAWTAGTATGSIAVTEAPAGTQYAVTFVGTQTGVAGTLTAAKADGTSVTSGSDVDENTVLTFTFVAGTAPADGSTVKLGDATAKELANGVITTFTFDVTVTAAVDFGATAVTVTAAPVVGTRHAVTFVDQTGVVGTLTATAKVAGTPVTSGSNLDEDTVVTFTFVANAAPTVDKVVKLGNVEANEATTGTDDAAGKTFTFDVTVTDAIDFADSAVTLADAYGVTVTDSNTKAGVVTDSTQSETDDKAYTTPVTVGTTKAKVTITLAAAVPVGREVTVTYTVNNDGETTGTIEAGETTLVIEVPVSGAVGTLTIASVVEAGA